MRRPSTVQVTLAVMRNRKQKMITRIETVNEIIPIFKEYLAHISQFLPIKDYGPWSEGALKHLRLYEINSGRHMYVIREPESIIGFALINKHLRFNADGFAVAEFYIQKDRERKGHGRRLAEYVFAQFPGNWEVAVASTNTAARMFWRQVLSSYTHDTFTESRNTSFDGYGFLFSNA